ncbi:MAG: ABC transporter ATP-binding protein [Thermoplasmata archaeon]|nr:MAG: ABC transporter ATP-binding protein [Thermoplasmata archaeon]
MSMIEIQNLQKKFGRKFVLNDLSLDVDKGDFLVLFGPNGAGKTTLIKILATLSRPSSGKVSINGHVMAEEPIEVRGSIGVISHNPFLYDDLTFGENLLFYQRMYGLKKDQKAVKGLADRVGLLHRLNDIVGNFSRGMKQRAAVARAVIHDPPVLLLDEPYTGLDFKAWGMLTDMLSGFHEEGKTVLLITHNVELGHGIGDRLACLINGRIAFDCKKKDIEMAAFKDRYQDLMEAKK